MSDPSEPATSGNRSSCADGPVPPPRRRWAAPRLIRFGDVRQLTMGPTPGVGESGNGAIFKV